MATSTKKSKQSIGETLETELLLRDKMTFNAKTGTIDVPKDYYEKTLEHAGLTMEQVEAVQKHQLDMVSASYIAGGKLVADEALVNNDIGEVQLSYNAGHHHHQLFFNPRADENQEAVRDVVTLNEPNKGEVTKAMNLIKGLFDNIENDPDDEEEGE
jgi:hypothetical protein